ncbi:glycoside hydrolase family 2 TIM barrel-domain containing protein [Actinomyces procaprae]|uniref:glycoside hydrolase family 2 TIM barrel-domain containing protein n=1 Tax=Actinomyces procaprae TaxID=2560010 RepID=UPI00109DFC94|nr:glycoside hydrolase family 2 TIM barrel-domain containing protein [Actinomyces procaprae]
MSTTVLFDAGWQLRREPDGDAAARQTDAASDVPDAPGPWTAVDLPHDAMIHEPRSAATATTSGAGWFPGGTYRYRKSLHVPDDLGDDRLSLVFEGVYKNSTVLLDGVRVGGCRGGYTEFEVDLGSPDPGTQAVIEVLVDNSRQPSTRWYSGSGIYRHVWLRRTGPVRLTRGGTSLPVVCLEHSPTGTSATATARIEIDNPHAAAVTVTAVLTDDSGEAARGSVSTNGGVVELPLRVAAAHPWSDADPHLYELTVTLTGANEAGDDVVLDAATTRTGLRTIEVDANRGLLVNGRPTALRGACIHHDSGILGAVTFADAERRRVRILKKQGFNAIRSAHNPASRDLLAACDELGLYVMDELWDMWFQAKNPHDDASHFEQSWAGDAEALVRKDRLHPCVIMYSIGNEVGESATPRGIRTARRIVSRLHRLDPTRPTTAGINLMINLMTARGRDLVADNNAAGQRRKQDEERARGESGGPKRQSVFGSTAYNLLVSRMGSLMSRAAATRAADRASAGVLDALDVAGYNYAASRYRKDAVLHPGRVIVGSETMPHEIVRNWRLVEELDHVIGDFMWTGWDYLGEVGIGLWTYGEEPGGFDKPYPYVTAGVGAIDITGHPDGSMALARTVWTRAKNPEIAVRPLDRAGRRVHKAAWRGTDAVPSWVWPEVAAGTRAQVEVYSYAPQVELFVGDHSLGTRPAGVAHGCVAHFTVPYGPEDLTAVARVGDREVGRATLPAQRGAPRLRVRADRGRLHAGGQDLAFLELEAVDERGNVAMIGGTPVSVEVSGAGRLAALGSADPRPASSYDETTTPLYRGRALAIVRAGAEPGTVQVGVRAGELGEQRLTLVVEPAGR